METRANHIVIGVFVLALVAGVLAFVYWVRSDGISGPVRTYSVLFEGGVAGVRPSSDVLFNGLRIGKVDRVAIYGPDTRKVQVTMRIAESAPVRTDSRARIVQRGLTSLASITITPGSPDAELLHANASGEVISILPDRAQVRPLFEAAPSVLAKADAAFSRLDTLIAENEEEVSRILDSLDTFTRALAENEGRVTSALANAEAATERLKEAAAKLETFVDSENPESFAGEATVAAARLSSMADKLDKSIGDKADDMAETAENGLRQFEQLMKDGRRTVRRLEATVETIRRKPQSLLFGSSGE